MGESKDDRIDCLERTLSQAQRWCLDAQAERDGLVLSNNNLTNDLVATMARERASADEFEDRLTKLEAERDGAQGKAIDAILQATDLETKLRAAQEHDNQTSIECGHALVRAAELDKLQEDDLLKAAEFAVLAELAAARIEKTDARVAELEALNKKMIDDGKSVAERVLERLEKLQATFAALQIERDTYRELAEDLECHRTPLPIDGAPKKEGRLILLHQNCSFPWVLGTWAVSLVGIGGWLDSSGKEIYRPTHYLPKPMSPIEVPHV